MTSNPEESSPKTERPVCPTCGAPVTIEPKRWTGTAAMHLDPPEAYDATVRFDPEAVIRPPTDGELIVLGEREVFEQAQRVLPREPSEAARQAAQSVVCDYDIHPLTLSLALHAAYAIDGGAPNARDPLSSDWLDALHEKRAQGQCLTDTEQDEMLEAHRSLLEAYHSTVAVRGGAAERAGLDKVEIARAIADRIAALTDEDCQSIIDNLVAHGWKWMRPILAGVFARDGRAGDAGEALGVNPSLAADESLRGSPSSSHASPDERMGFFAQAQLADDNERLRARVAALEAALAPFATSSVDGSGRLIVVPSGARERARAVLAGTPEEKK